MNNSSHTLQIVIVDDQQAAIDVIEAQAAKCEHVFVALATTDAFEAIRFCRKNRVDAVFLDIRMDVMDGFEFIEQLRDPPPIVFTTAYEEFAVESYEVGVIDYLIKPVDFGQFARAIQRVEATSLVKELKAPPTNDDGEPRIALKVEHKAVVIDLKDIILLEANRNLTVVRVLGESYCFDNHEKIIGRRVDTLNVNMPFGQLYNALPHPQFTRVHRSFAVALDMVHEFHGGFLKLNHLPHRHISVSKQYQSSLAQLLGQRWESK